MSKKGCLLVALVFGFTVMTAMEAGAYNIYPSYNVTPLEIATAYGTTQYALGEGLQVYFTNSGTSFAPDPAISKSYNGAYDGPGTSGDDVVIAFINKSTSNVASITMTGNGNGGGAFAFDGDDNFGVGVSSISNITTTSVLDDTGTVNFSGGGLAPDGVAWWAFESSATSLSGTISGTTSTVPEPSTMLLLGSGLVGLTGYGRKKFFKK